MFDRDGRGRRRRGRRVLDAAKSRWSLHRKQSASPFGGAFCSRAFRFCKAACEEPAAGTKGVWKCVALATKACARRTSSTTPAAVRDRATPRPSLFSFSPNAPELSRVKPLRLTITSRPALMKPHAPALRGAAAREGRNRPPLFRVFFEEQGQGEAWHPARDSH